MKKTRAFVLTGAVFCAVTAWSCASKTTRLDFGNVPDNERCQYMKDVCKEAQSFQGKYEQMSREEREEAKAILNAYVQQCEGAQELCRKSQ